MKRLLLVWEVSASIYLERCEEIHHEDVNYVFDELFHKFKEFI